MLSSLDISFTFSTAAYLAGLGILLTILYRIVVIIYNVYFHPLANFPGPKSRAATFIPYAYASVRGRHGHCVKEIHDQYGHVVRISPNELSFTTSEAWKAIYGSQPGQPHNQKDAGFYPRTIGGVPSMTVSNDEDHYRFRRTLSHAFSESALRAQEPIIKSYVNLLIQRLREHCGAGKGAAADDDDNKPLNMVSWYNFATFDIVGDMAFGESFSCLQNSTYNRWVSYIFSNIKNGVYKNVARRFPGSGVLLRLILPARLEQEDQWHRKLTTEKVKSRLSKSNDRVDFFAHILKQKDTERALSFPEMLTNSSSFIIAGSETTATLLSAVTYYLLKNTHALTKLQHEVRNAFTSETDITVLACNRLEYLTAVLLEAFRIFPPIPIGLPRVINNPGVLIAGQWVPGGTVAAIPHFSAFHSERNFTHAESFIPERFLDDPRFANDDKDVLQPFSFGPRNCIGKNLAYAEMRLILAHVIFNFDMELDERSDNWPDQDTFLFWLKPDLLVRLYPRSGCNGKEADVETGTIG